MVVAANAVRVDKQALQALRFGDPLPVVVPVVEVAAVGAIFFIAMPARVMVAVQVTVLMVPAHQLIPLHPDRARPA
jgi:hypothetical protein